ncbi:MAG: adenylyltransferase/cytidyltransferase family protein [Opitutaceae bacterium]|nr:adenylyltransferase/cytidyltransferase family protein [Verrucomicrobiales bacterium]
MHFLDKILSTETLPSWREKLRAEGKKLVVTNGCFDLLHLGHVTYLECARNLGDVLLIGVTADEGVRQLKGPTRPINTHQDRAAVLAALEAVSAVYVFHDLRATNFLKLARPDIYVKGGDFTVDTIPPEERHAVEQAGGTFHFLPFVTGKSTTSLVEKIHRL